MARPTSPEPTGSDRLLALTHPPAEVAARTRTIYDAVLARSRSIRRGNFTTISTDDLALLFDLYDGSFFDGFLAARLRERDARGVHWRLSSRLTSAAGTTAYRRFRQAGPDGRVVEVDHYTITVSTTLLFGTFRDGEAGRAVSAGGVVVCDRLEAIQRIMEHELLHLAEFLVWGRSNCRAETFQRLSRQIFAHEAVHHDLVTPRERAATEHGIRVGDAVRFEFEGRVRRGIVNRITRRATVLVPDPTGRRFSDGHTYLTFYVPLAALTRDAPDTSS